ncbi:MAG TPA: HEAT repeat domain-containing protein [Chloroflexia bacterium]|nr:HEAT repeat domain-containing protein [Chloroflexia bacterium]
MLEALDRIDWSALSHAYGPADDVPGLIRDLASSAAEVRRQAMHALYGNIWHQGTVYEATAYAVPFLIALLQEESVPDRDEILVLLSHLADGNSYLDVHQHLGIFQELYQDEMQTPEFQEKLEGELSGVRNAHRAVLEGIGVYGDLLDHPDRKLRVAATYTLAGFTERASQIIPRLQARLAREPDAQVAAGLLLSLSVLVTPEPAMVQFFVDRLASEDRSLVRLAAAMALARLAGTQTPRAAVNVLVQTIANPAPLAALYQELPWANGDVVGDTSLFLARAGAPAAGHAIPILIQALEQVSAFSALHIAEALLALTFADPPWNQDATAQDLTAVQRQVLTGIGVSSNAWRFNVNMSEILQAFGLPDWPDKLQKFLEPGTMQQP